MNVYKKLPLSFSSSDPDLHSFLDQLKDDIFYKICKSGCLLALIHFSSVLLQGFTPFYIIPMSKVETRKIKTHYETRPSPRQKIQPRQWCNGGSLFTVHLGNLVFSLLALIFKFPLICLSLRWTFCSFCDLHRDFILKYHLLVDPL